MEIAAKNLVYQYRNNGIVDNFVLSCPQLICRGGEIIFILGPNGSGKTTLLGLLGGNLNATSGNILIDGDDNGIDVKRSLRGKSVFLDTNIMDNMAKDLLVSDHLCLALKANDKSLPFFSRFIKCDDLLSEYDVEDVITKEIGKIFTRKVGQLSSGQRQILLITIAILLEKSIIIADESSNNMDLYNCRLHFNRLKKLSKNHQSIIAVATHDIMLAAEYGDSFYSVINGKVFPIIMDKTASVHDKYYKILEAILPGMNSREQFSG